jgi:hypothetical protein
MFSKCTIKLYQELSEIKKKVTYCMNPPIFRTKHPCGWMKPFFIFYFVYFLDTFYYNFLYIFDVI